MDWIQSLVLGIVQGLTEFLPISSTAHLRIVPHLLDWDDPGTEFKAAGIEISLNPRIHAWPGALRQEQCLWLYLVLALKI